jgi:hypothetical protein
MKSRCMDRENENEHLRHRIYTMDRHVDVFCLEFII